MGLDNGIFIRNIEKKEIPWFVRYDEFLSDGDIEICYWRKEYGLRNRIVERLNQNSCCEIGDGMYKLNRDDIADIIKITQRFLNRKYYTEYANSIWTYREAIRPYIKRCINLHWVYLYMKNNPTIEIYFYDNY